ncbi:hypothetical protein [Adhaeribacter soli]|uniref:Outer membrane beta-barrel protein n=1 Tax=Adhaeribacter soli TaxID=2607655 RepID=A0A5N1IU45_9BACT|nr:hypothetical protein [Adhaeribacter soli]KAA9331856.1 hypothetical protein F0P94_13745 [Adhaeribacter soli]
MKKTLILFWLILAAFYHACNAQGLRTDSAEMTSAFQHGVYLEAGGAALLGSLNYEMRYNFPTSNRTIAFRVGGLYLPEGKADGKQKYWQAIPVEVSTYAGKRDLKMEFGLGLTYLQRVYKKDSDNYEAVVKEKGFLPVPRIGLRYEKADTPFFARLALTPLVIGTLKNDSDFILPPVLPWFGLSFGYTFSKQ